MAGARRLRHWTRKLVAIVAAGLFFVLVLAAAAVLGLQTPWAKNQLRALMVRQANDYLVAHLDIGRLEGSLFSSITLRDVRLQQDGRTLVAIDAVSVVYSIREIWSQGVSIDRIRLVRPRVTATRQPDGRWDLASLVRKTSQEQQRKGPGRSVHLGSIDVEDGTIVLKTPVAFGAVHIPTRYDHLNTRLSYDYAPVHWTLRFASMSWTGTDPDLQIDSLTGALGDGPHGFTFERLAVETPRTSFVVSGTIHNERRPTGIDMDVHAGRFAFQEWGGILHGLQHIAVESGFDVGLHGPLSAMVTDLRLRSSAGAIDGGLTLDTSVPGWHGRGAVDIARLDLAGWLSRRDRPSDITGHVVFDLALRLGEGFPRGRYEFRGPHAAFMEYAADDVTARGQIDAKQVIVTDATARAYGADVTAKGTIAIDDPYPFRFAGTAARLDLRRVPKTVPVPRVETTLTFEYDVRGQFADAFVAGRARLATSTFLGATIADGTVGTIDSSAHPLRYSGDGGITNVDLARFGEALDIAILREPRYRGRVDGRFTLSASGTNAAELDLHASGRLARADVFEGRLADANATLDIAGGTLAASFDGAFDRINPAIPLLDRRFDAALSGNGRVAATVRDLMLRTPTAADYTIDWNLAFRKSTVHGVEIDSGRTAGAFRESLATFAGAEATGPVGSLRGSGTLAFTDIGASDFTFTLARADLARVGSLVGAHLGGQLTAAGRLTGPWARPHLSGSGTALDVSAPGVYALSASGDYDFDVPAGDPVDATARVAAKASFVTIGGREIQHADGTLALANRAVSFKINATESADLGGAFEGTVTVGANRQSVTLDALTADLGGRWTLARAGAPPRVEWNAEGVSIEPLTFVGGSGGRLDVGGTWRPRGGGELHLKAAEVHLESLQNPKRPPRYRGVVNADVTVRGTREAPIVTGAIGIVNGAVDRFTYAKVAGRVDYTDQRLAIDFRVDQAPGVWLTATGTVPLSLFNRRLPDAPIDVRILSSPIELGLLNGLTSVVASVSGRGQLDVHAIGTSRDPHFAGRVQVSDGSFVVAATGVAYNRVAATFTLARERITVDSLHVEDANHNPLDLHGSLATHELTVGGLQITAKAREFTVMRNELGRIAIDADVDFGGKFESPVLEGEVSVSAGTLNVDEILEQTLFRPYATQAATGPTGIDPIAALNPWDRMRLNVTLHVPDTLRLAGDNVQVSPGTPIGLGNINLRVGGDLVLLKDPGQPLAVYGSFDTISGTYSFQGRRFDVLQASSINFRGAVSPELYVTVAREISGVEARVTITGALGSPELHLASSPPLETADILSLIVFNTSVNDLTAVQQQQLVVRAGALAAGFLAAPLVSALENRIGLDVLEVSPGGDTGVSPKVTVGEEIAPGLFARFSRQFGENEYDQLEIEYYLTRILRLRATFSDAASLNLRSPFRRIERGGIDLLLFFSF